MRAFLEASRRVQIPRRSNGAALLLWLINVFTGGRGIGKGARNW
jgi:hypothetical protein